jgi:hypothetical protein
MKHLQIEANASIAAGQLIFVGTVEISLISTREGGLTDELLTAGKERQSGFLSATDSVHRTHYPIPRTVERFRRMSKDARLT